ncbi:MAG: methyltransferase domain-containing protein [Candidatus Bathyarchaeota archaeon]
MSGDRKEPDDLAERITGWHYSLGWGDGSDSVAPYVPTPMNVVHEMLKLARAGPGDVLYDLGCGDGRIILAAVEEYNVDRAVGYEINPQMAEATRMKVYDKELQDRIAVLQADFFGEDLSEASVVTLYLTTSGNAKLRPKLEKELRVGARVVSHDFPVSDWVHSREEERFYMVGSHKLFLYEIPEAYMLDKKAPEGDSWDRLRRMFERRDSR